MVVACSVGGGVDGNVDEGKAKGGGIGGSCYRQPPRRLLVLSGQIATASWAPAAAGPDSHNLIKKPSVIGYPDLYLAFPNIVQFHATVSAENRALCQRVFVYVHTHV